MTDTTYKKNSKVVEEMSIELEISGLKPGTSLFEAELRSRKVEQCKIRHCVTSCQECPYFEHCTLIKEHLMDIRFGVNRSH